MTEFKPIETQEQLNEVIGERVRRAEEKAAEKYSAIETQNAEYATQIAQLQDQIQKQTETINGNKAIVDELTQKVQTYETASVKTKVALELGLPYQMAGRLSGSTEEEIRADAETMVKLIGKQKQPAPLGSNEPVITDPKNAAWTRMAAQLANE